MNMTKAPKTEPAETAAPAPEAPAHSDQVDANVPAAHLTAEALAPQADKQD
jgi:hypothetical protein